MKSIPSAGETNLYSAKPAMFRAHPVIFLLVLVLIFAWGIGGILLFAWLIYTSSIKLVITNRRTLLHKGVFKKQMVEIAHDEVGEVQLDQGGVSGMFLVGTISINKRDSAEALIKVRGMPNAELVRRLIHNLKA